MRMPNMNANITARYETYCMKCHLRSSDWNDACPSCGSMVLVHLLSVRCNKCGKVHDDFSAAEQCCDGKDDDDKEGE